MSRTLKRLQSLGAKAGAFALSGVLALSMTPAVALANDGLAAGDGGSLIVASDDAVFGTSDYVNTIEGGTKNIIGNNGDALNGKVQPVASGTDKSKYTYQYMGYAHSDNGGHYQAYSLYTKIKTDDDGILTAIDVTSGNDTFAGKWGYQQAKAPSLPTSDSGGSDSSSGSGGSGKSGGSGGSSSGKSGGSGSGSSSGKSGGSGSGGGGDKSTTTSAPIEGFLPVDVSFTAQKTDDGKYVAKLSGADDMGYLVNQVTYMSINDSPSLTVANESPAIKTVKTGEGYDAKTTYNWGSDLVIANAQSGTSDNSTMHGDLTISIPTDDPAYNLVKCTYIIGSEKTAFNVYFYVDEAAKQYVKNKAQTTWVEDPVNDKDGANYTTNRDGWTAIMASVMMRELASWGAAMADPSLSTELDGELGGIDTVSGATKTSVPFVQALVAAREQGYIKGVSEDLEITIDGDNTADASSLPRLEPSNATKSQDRTTVTKGDDGSYTANVMFKPEGGGRLTLNSISLYKLGGQTLGTQGMMVLAKQGTPAEGEEKPEETYSAVKTYPIDVKYGATEQDYVKLSDDVSDDDAEFAYKTSGDYKFTVKNKDVTHIVANYTVGHGTIAIAYDLANMAKVASVNEKLAAAKSIEPATVTAARQAYDALPYDVRPFTTGIATLHTAEAGVVSAQLAAVSQDNEAGVKSARAAYDALDTKAKAQVTSESYKNLTDAETAIAANKYTVKSVTLAQTSYTYSGSANKPGVTVKAADGSTIAASNYKVDYKDNTNAGTATVTVTGKGSYSGSATAKFTIARAQVAMPTAKAGLVYNGKSQTGVAAGTGYEVKDGSATDAGSHTATAKLDGNHAWTGGSTADAKVSYTIAPAASSIKLAAQSKTYTGKALAYSGKVTKTGSTGKVTYSYYSDKACKKAVKAANVKKAGTYYVKATVAAAGNYAAATSSAVKFTVKKASQTIKPAKSVYTAKYNKKKAQKIAVKFKANGGGKVTYAAAKSGKVSIAKNGKVTVKKGAAKKTYTLKVKVTAAAKGNYAKTVKTVKLKVKVS